jgi:hypothetical protein
VVTKDEALKLALEALGNSWTEPRNKQYEIEKEAITAIKEALAQPAPPPECKTEAEQTAYAFGWWKALEYVRTEQPAQEPVAWTGVDFDIKTTPPQRPWVELTDEDMGFLFPHGKSAWVQEIVKIIEAKLKEKNT